VVEREIGGISRREFLAKAAAGGTGALLSLAGPAIEKAYGAGPCSGHLTDIEHFVLFMQEKRSFDHYFGTLSGTNGFDSPSPLFQQKGWNPQTQALDPAGVTLPYRFDTTRGPALDGQCVNDPDHTSIALHESWNGGGNDNWLPAQATTHKPCPPKKPRLPAGFPAVNARDTSVLVAQMIPGEQWRNGFSSESVFR
jgi:phospholipase C